MANKKNTPHSDNKKIDKAGKKTKGQDKAASKGGKAADKSTESAFRKLFKGL